MAKRVEKLLMCHRTGTLFEIQVIRRIYDVYRFILMNVLLIIVPNSYQKTELCKVSKSYCLVILKKLTISFCFYADIKFEKGHEKLIEI